MGQYADLYSPGIASPTVLVFENVRDFCLSMDFELLLSP